MTTITPAEARPPPLRPPDPTRHPSQTSSITPGPPVRKQSDAGLFRPLEEQESEERPAKRRRTGSTTGLEDAGPSQPTQPLAAPKATSVNGLISDLRVLSAILYGPSAEQKSKVESAEPSPLPSRPWKQLRPRQKGEDAKPTHRARALLQVPSTPDTMEEPTSVPQWNDRPAGYFPWTGNHPEDILGDANVRNGFSDRSQMGQEKETNTARGQLFPILKHRAGIESLSALFSVVLEAKNRHDVVKTTSTFKPPPRVTLAEAKRKSWIADLAAPDVHLRKLSRTIPQGIRGQILLDQCIQNNVPLSRAIWFAKCVGANEIRTLKRKGTTPAAAFGEENKWLREWTRNVEQFLESVLAQIGQSDWKSNVQYAVRLATRLYLENLVDRDNYLDWIVNAFVNTNSDRLPFWLMFVQIYKRDITNSRRKGKKLAEALLAKYASFKDISHTLAQTLAQKLSEAVSGIAHHRPRCFLLPDVWPSVRATVQACLSDESLFARLDRINERCMGSKKREYGSTPDPQELVIDTLDATKAPYNAVVLSKRLFEICANPSILITTCLEWATSKFRCGSARVYLTVRLLRHWHRQGCNVDSLFLDFLAQVHGAPSNTDSDALKHLFAELSRSRTFSVSRYLQWLNVRGLPQSKSILLDVITQRHHLQHEHELLLDLPLLENDGHVYNMRNAMLAKAGLQPGREAVDIEAVVGRVQQELLRLRSEGEDAVAFDHRLIEEVSRRNWIFRSRLSTHLRAFVVGAVKNQIQAESASTLSSSSLTWSQFSFLRECLEVMADESVLADVIGLCCSVSDERLQAALVETLSRHAPSFSAIGALEPLQAKLCHNYMALRNIKPTMPLLATALLDLCSLFPSKLLSIRLLQQDLVRGDRGRAISACSPFSDGVAESLQQAQATFIDDFEAVLQSEPSMNEQTMTRLFALLTERIQKHTSGSEDMTFTFCRLMARLRLCRRVQGDQLIKAWLKRVLAAYPLSFKRSLVDCIIDAGCLSIDVLVEVAGNLANFNVAQVLPLSSGDEASRYSVKSKWLEFAFRRPATALELMSKAGQVSQPMIGTQELIKRVVLHQSSDGNVSLPTSDSTVKDQLHNLLLPNSEDQTVDLYSIDTLSLPFVQVHLRLQSSMHVEQDNRVVNSLSAFASKSSGPCRHLPRILQSLPPEIAVQVRDVAEQKVLDMLSLSVTQHVEDDGSDHVQAALSHLSKVCQGAPSSPPNTLVHLVEKLSQLLKALGKTGAPAKSSTPTSPTSTFAAQMPSLVATLMQPVSPMETSRSVPATVSVEHLPSLLQLLCLVRPQTDTSTQSAKQPQSEYIKILALLTSITTHPAFSPPSALDLTAFSHDVMATYSDALTPDAHALVCKVVKDKVKEDATDGRLRWLFGSVNVYGSDLQEAEEMGRGLRVMRKGEDKGEWRPRVWEVMSAAGVSGGREADVSLGLGMFGVRRA